MGERRALIIFGLLHAVIFLGLFTSLGRQFYYGPGEFERWVSLHMLQGQVPYRDFLTEYPPLALLSFLLPGLFFRTPMAYSWAFSTEMLLLDLVGLTLVAASASRLGVSSWGSLGIYTVTLLSVGPIAISRYDLLPAVLVLAALHAFIAGRNKLAWAILALGVAAKGYPAIIAPLLALCCLRHRGYRRLMEGVVAFAAVLLIVVLPCVLLSAQGFWQFLSFHAQRGLHSESSYASVLLIGQILGLTQLEAGFSFGSWNLSSPLADTLARVSPYIAVGLLLAVYSLYTKSLWRAARPKEGMVSLSPEESRLVVNHSLLAVLAFLLTSKLFSPQFLVWLCPLLPLIGGRWRHLSWWLFVAVGGLTQYLFPYHYIEFELGCPHLIGILAGRNLLLVVMALLLTNLTRPVHHDRMQRQPGEDYEPVATRGRRGHRGNQDIGRGGQRRR